MPRSRCAPAAITALVALVLLTGCGGGSEGEAADAGDAAPTVSQDASPAPPATTKIGPFIEQLASSNVEGLDQAVKLAAPGSLAAAYAQHQANQTTSVADGGGVTGEQGKVTEEGESFKVCYPDQDGAPCYVYGDFKLAPNGAPASFTIDKRPLNGRLTLGNGAAQTSPLGDVKFLSAYTTQGGDQAVAVRVRAKARPIIIHDAAATYRAPDGRQRVQMSFSGPSDLGGNSVAYLTFYFKGPVGFGGTMALELIDDGDEYAEPAIVTVKTK